MYHLLSTTYHLPLVRRNCFLWNFCCFTVPKAQIQGSTELFVKTGSDINITCVISDASDKSQVVWYHISPHKSKYDKSFILWWTPFRSENSYFCPYRESNWRNQQRKQRRSTACDGSTLRIKVSLTLNSEYCIMPYNFVNFSSFSNSNSSCCDRLITKSIETMYVLPCNKKSQLYFFYRIQIDILTWPDLTLSSSL